MARTKHFGDEKEHMAHSAVARKEEQSVRRLTLNLSADAYDELAGLAKVRRTTMTDVIRLALALVKIAIQEKQDGNKLMVTGPRGEPLRELVLP